MKSNAPEFLANVAEALYEEDPIYFDMKRLMPEIFKNYIEAEVRSLCGEPSYEFMADHEQTRVKMGLSRIQ
jgi:hypothetical protein